MNKVREIQAVIGEESYNIQYELEEGEDGAYSIEGVFLVSEDGEDSTELSEIEYDDILTDIEVVVEKHISENPLTPSTESVDDDDGGDEDLDEYEEKEIE